MKPNNTDRFPNIFVAVLNESLSQGGSETEVTLSSIRSLDGQPMNTEDFQFLGRGVLSVDVQSAQRAEFVSFTGIDATAKQCTGCKRGLSFNSDTVRPANKKFHAVGAPVIIAFGTHNLIDLENLLGNAGPLQTGITRLFTDPSVVLGNPTITIADPAVITLTAHGLTPGDQVVFTTNGNLPTGIVSGKTYYVLSTGLTANTFEISKALTGDAVITTGAQSGTHILTRITPYAASAAGTGKVLVDGADTTPGFLDPKLNIHSTDNSINVTKSITNPAGNEVLDYNLSSNSNNLFFPFEFDTTVSGVPAAGHLTYDNAVPSAVTLININNTDGLGNPIRSDLSLFAAGDKIMVVSIGSPANYATYVITSNTDMGTYSQFGVTFDSANGTFVNNEPVTLTMVHVASGANITVKDNGVALGSFSILNIKPGLTVTDEGGGQAGISSEAIAKSVHQIAHGFIVGNVIKSSGVDDTFTKSQANLLVNSDTIGIVVDVIDVDHFVYTTEGDALIVTLPGGADAGDILYLSDATPGGLTLTAPSAPGTIIKQLGEVINAATGLIYFHNYLGLTQAQENPSSGGGSGAITSNQNMLFKVGLATNTSFSSPQILRFSDKLFVYDGNGSGSAPYLQFSNDAITGAIIEESATTFFPMPGGYSNYQGIGLSTSEDGTKLYAFYIVVQAFGANPLWTLNTFDVNMNLIATSNYTTTASISGQGALCPFFVYNDGIDDHVVSESCNHSTASDGFWTDWVISGATLINPQPTNLKFINAGGGGRVSHVVATYKQGNAYIQGYSSSNGITPGVDKRSYSSLTFGVATTNGLAIPDFTYQAGATNVDYGGFEVPTATTIGRWRNTSFSINQTGGGSPPAINYLSGIYNEYTF